MPSGLPLPPLRHFSVAEFQHPERLDHDFLRWLDAIREACEIAFRLTSDARTPEENAALTGSSPTSWHLQGRAVDFVPRPWSPESLAAITEAVVAQGKPYELEFVAGPHDNHIHLALLPEGRSARIVLALD